jgi:hypothetical protein
MMPVADAWTVADPTLCPECGSDSCEAHLPPLPAPPQLDAELLTDATVVAAEGRQIAQTGVPYLVSGLIPAYGMLGFHVAAAKVGKTTNGQHLGAAVAMGRPFLGRPTRQRRVLDLAVEDPAEYTAWLARHLNVDPGVMTFYRGPLLLNPEGLARIAGTIAAGQYGLVLISSWQAVVRGSIRDENDNAAAVRVVEAVKAMARQTEIPWLIDAHTGKGEDQTDDADPSKAMRGASAAAGAADYTLLLRYANGAFGGLRRLSGKGRFINFAPILFGYDAATGRYDVINASNTSADTTWRVICETGALTKIPQTAGAIARAAGLDGPSSTTKRNVVAALNNREGVGLQRETRNGKESFLYYRIDEN